MGPNSFTEYALRSTLTEDEVYTIELLIELVRKDFDGNYWDEWMARSDARREPDYSPHFDPKMLPAAEKALVTLSWLSFQRAGAVRPVRNLQALRYLPALKGLVLNNSEVADLSPLQSCSGLRTLELAKTSVSDLSSLTCCCELEELNLRETALISLEVLETLPKLRELTISSEQVPALEKLRRLPALEKLEISGEAFESFARFPEMPALRVIWGPKVRSLDGLERFPNVENLVNFGGDFPSLDPLKSTKKLTHANILDSQVASLAPLSGLLALRDLRLSTGVAELDLSPLWGLPALHEVSICCNGETPADLTELQSQLSSWDVEFREERARFTPSLQLEVVDQDTFDFYDGGQPYGLTASDRNREMLASELEWLDEQLEEIFSVDFEEDTDYCIPFRWGEARSRTVMVMSERAVEAFRRVVLQMQTVLCHARYDWILYFQSDEQEADFIVWVYPNKIVTTEEYADIVRNLIRH
jgi:hypothetical protein